MLNPLFCTFDELVTATEALHQGDAVEVARLHDIWKMGAPSPDSRVLLPRYDERVAQVGVVIKRLVLPSQFVAWVQAVSARRGFPYSVEQAQAMYEGRTPPP